ncbi:tetratricopeptide repeat protein [Candidatus Marithrix sp. Canyon 246]|uniref:tetratricopeptide repeat protein n=1 Tax=Candidatus Marithrix sp. Canyon 246 TaxID=1827136 RepID=UPI000849F3DE|nr:tetratricopeptide repeat protein [Candidatus Marithrix sp. Canyon 246]
MSIEQAKVLLKKGKPKAAIKHYQKALAKDSNSLLAYLGLGHCLKETKQYDLAINILLKAIAIHPRSASLHLNLANVYNDLSQLDVAIDYYQKALALNPNYALAYNNLANVFKQQQRLAEAALCYHKAVILKPDSAEIHHNFAISLETIEQFEAALSHYQQAIALNPDYIDAHFNRGLLLFSLAQFEPAWSEHIWRPSKFLYYKTLEKPFNKKLPLLTNNLQDKTIFLNGEQGLGDELFFLRYAPELKARGANIHYRCHIKNASLLSRVSCLDKIISDEKVLFQGKNSLLVGDLPLALAMTTKAAPPLALSVLPERLEAMRKRLAALGKPPYLAVTWWAGCKPDENSTKPTFYREIDLTELGKVLAPIDATILILQRNPTEAEINKLTYLVNKPVHDLSAFNEDLEDMLALLKLLDDYICVHNTNIHLMAGIAKTARILIPYPPEWRDMKTGKESPWFKGFKLYRQSSDKSWSQALNDLKRDLRSDDSNIME